MSIYYQKSIVVKKLRTEFKEGQPIERAPTISKSLFLFETEFLTVTNFGDAMT